jgi:hypothetical protein
MIIKTIPLVSSFVAKIILAKLAFASGVARKEQYF